MDITYDSQADILYIELRRHPAEDAADIEPGITVMLDKEKRIVGIEVLGASKLLGPAQLRSVTLRDVMWDTSVGIGPNQLTPPRTEGAPPPRPAPLEGPRGRLQLP